MRSAAFMLGAILSVVSQVVAAQTLAPVSNLTGVWDSAGGGAFQVFQGGARVTLVFVNPDFAHRFDGVYVDRTTVKGHQVRVTRPTGCITEMDQTITIVSNDFFTVEAVALDSNCDLAQGQVITNSATRIY